MHSARPTCYTCHRPEPMCVCKHVTRVDNRTGIHILQHPRERFHPFGTVKLVRLALGNVDVRVARPNHEGQMLTPLELPARTGLLYPRRDAVELRSLAPHERPDNLLVLDGTWRQAHCLYRDNPWLAGLPHYALSPSTPSAYRIRKEPADHCLSTIESIVLALSALEPDTPGIDGLMRSFTQMVDTQLQHRRENHGAPRRRKRPRQRRLRRVPIPLVDEPQRMLVAYGESAQLRSRRDPQVRELLQWAAVRLDTGECFEAFIRPSAEPPCDGHVATMGLTREQVDAGVDMDTFLTRWQSFCGAQDSLVIWNQSTGRLLEQATSLTPPVVHLKAAYCNVRGGPCGTIEEVIAREQLQPQALPVAGRAGQRLANALAISRLLRESAAAAATGGEPPSQVVA